jgi:peptidoglycan/LPS O-acetylase OafA/YrhL
MKPAGSLSYLPSLDALRAFAVCLVLHHHWVGPPDLPTGPIGVWIFFVLSGFLITRILLSARADTLHGNRHALLHFYGRRFLRIFPLYYFVLILGLFFSEALRRDWPWYVTYLQNYRMIWASDPDGMFGVHLWTLAVEEQFYLVWPLLMLFLPRVLLLPTIVLAITSAITLRAVLAGMQWAPFQTYAFTPNNLDTLALGALLAYVVTYVPDRIVVVRQGALVAGVVIGLTGLMVHTRPLGAALMPVPTGLFATCYIAYAVSGFRGPLPRLFFEFPPSVYLGRISYGVYVYHFFVPDLLRRLGLKDGGVPFVALCFLVTIAVASLSWFFLEKPVNSLKSRFPMPGRCRQV